MPRPKLRLGGVFEIITQGEAGNLHVRKRPGNLGPAQRPGKHNS